MTRKGLKGLGADLEAGARKWAERLGLDYDSVCEKAAERVARFSRPGYDWPIPDRPFDGDDPHPVHTHDWSLPPVQHEVWSNLMRWTCARCGMEYSDHGTASPMEFSGPSACATCDEHLLASVLET